MGSQEGRAPVRVVDGTLLLPWSLMSEFPFRRGITHPLLGLVWPDWWKISFLWPSFDSQKRSSHRDRIVAKRFHTNRRHRLFGIIKLLWPNSI